jgi:hypothetical protein
LDQEGTIYDGVLDRICDISLKFNILPTQEAYLAIIGQHEAQERLDKAIKALERAIAGMPAGEEKERLTSIKESLEKLHPPKDTNSDATKRAATIKANVQQLYAEIQRIPLPRLAQQPDQASAKDLARAIIKDPKNQTLTALQIACHAGYLPGSAIYEPLGRNPGLIDQAQDKIEALESLIKERLIADEDRHGDDHDAPKFAQPWLCAGPKTAVPKCACYLGHYCHCGCDCYVWVSPEHMKTLRDFTLTVLALAPPDKQDLSSVLLRGAAVGPPASFR